MVKSEVKLSEEIKKGNYQAFEILVSKYETRIYSLAYNMLGKKEDAEDVLQETFMKAYDSLAKFRKKSSFSTWIYRIATNLCLDKLRKGKYEKIISLDEIRYPENGHMSHQFAERLDNPEEKLAEKEINSAIDKAINELSPDYRKILVLRDIEGFSTKEVSKIVGLSIAAVKSRLHRARLYIREKIGKIFESK